MTLESALDWHCSSYVLCQVTRMHCKGKELHRPVAYKDTTGKEITVSMVLYHKVDGNSESELHYRKAVLTTSIKFSDIMSHINLTVLPGTDILSLPSEEGELLQTAVQALIQNKSKQSRKRQREVGAADDGRRVLIVDPTPNETAYRRSTRVRTQVVHQFS